MRVTRVSLGSSRKCTRTRESVGKEGGVYAHFHQSGERKVTAERGDDSSIDLVLCKEMHRDLCCIYKFHIISAALPAEY